MDEKLLRSILVESRLETRVSMIQSWIASRKRNSNNSLLKLLHDLFFTLMYQPWSFSLNHKYFTLNEHDHVDLKQHVEFECDRQQLLSFLDQDSSSSWTSVERSPLNQQILVVRQDRLNSVPDYIRQSVVRDAVHVTKNVLKWTTETRLALQRLIASRQENGRHGRFLALLCQSSETNTLDIPLTYLA